MVNYSGTFTVGEAASILKVGKDLIKKWAYTFSDYLTSGANPPKHSQRRFEISDIRVLAYILLYWEETPEIECIKIGLNTNSQYEYQSISDLIVSITPIFIEPPENIDETWTHGAIYGGFAEFADTINLANSYKLAGDRLVTIALQNDESRDLMCPIVYTYRHATELYLKSIVFRYQQSHDLVYLFERFKEIVKTFDAAPPEWFKNIITVFNDFDPFSTSFRYGGRSGKDEVFIDYNHLKLIMDWFADSCRNINRYKATAYTDQ